MAKLLFHLRGVPEDEALAVRNLLAKNEIEITETNAGLLGIGTAAIWVADPGQYNTAKTLLDHYQEDRYREARRNYEIDKKAGKARQFIDLLRENPLRFTLSVAVIIGLVYLFVMPFFSI